MYTDRFGKEAPGFDDLIQRCRCDGRDALRAKPNVKLGTFARDANDGNQRIHIAPWLCFAVRDRSEDLQLRNRTLFTERQKKLAQLGNSVCLRSGRDGFLHRVAEDQGNSYVRQTAIACSLNRHPPEITLTRLCS